MLINFDSNSLNLIWKERDPNNQKEIEKNFIIKNLKSIDLQDEESKYVTKTYFENNLNKTINKNYQVIKNNNQISGEITDYQTKIVNILNLDTYKKNDNINIILPSNTNTIYSVIVIKLPVKEFLSSKYDNFIMTSKTTDDSKKPNNFITFSNSNNSSLKIFTDYFLNDMISMFFENESKNIDKYTNENLILKLSLQAEIINSILIGPVALYID